MIAKRTVAVYKPEMRTNKRKSNLKNSFSILSDPELMKNADKHVDNTDVPCAERNS